MWPLIKSQLCTTEKASLCENTHQTNKCCQDKNVDVCETMLRMRKLYFIFGLSNDYKMQPWAQLKSSMGWGSLFAGQM